MSTTTETIAQEVERLAELIKGIRIAMMTTVSCDGSLSSRPMATQDSPIDGGLWFFTYIDTTKVEDVKDESAVSLTYENPLESVYVSLSGRAVLVKDRKQMEKLWHEDLREWFPDGLNNPQLALLRVEIERWSYWTVDASVISEHRGDMKRPC